MLRNRSIFFSNATQVASDELFVSAYRLLLATNSTENNQTSSSYYCIGFIELEKNQHKGNASLHNNDDSSPEQECQQMVDLAIIVILAIFLTILSANSYIKCSRQEASIHP
ncbi:MAG: hypothetical protein V4496_03115 [Pseudomonadota bacterium]